jgi:hypothetical protein
LCPPVNPPHHLIPSEIKHLHSNALVFAGLQEKKKTVPHIFSKDLQDMIAPAPYEVICCRKFLTCSKASVSHGQYPA